LNNLNVAEASSDLNLKCRLQPPRTMFYLEPSRSDFPWTLPAAEPTGSAESAAD
jgi:hypothetical protein